MKRLTLFAVLCICCIVIGKAQTPGWQWGKGAVEPGTSLGTGVSCDANGNSYVTGAFNNSSITFGNITLNNAGTGQTRDIFLVKYDSSGNVIWAKSGKGTGDDGANAITTDANGNIYITGYFTSSTLHFDNNTITNAGGGGNDIFVVKYDPSGNVLWAIDVGGNGDDYANGICHDKYGHIYITGTFSSSTIILSSTNLGNAGSAGTYDMLVIEYDSLGNELWADDAGGTGNDYGNEVSIDDHNNLFATGYFQSSTIGGINGTTLLNAGASADEIFTFKYDSAGTWVWARGATGTNNSLGNSLTNDGQGNVYVSGTFTGTDVIFGSSTLTNAGGADILIVKYDSSGNLAWAKRAGGASNEIANGITTDRKGNIDVTGAFDDTTLTFGSTTINNTGAADIFVVQYDSSGNVLWAKDAGGAGSEVGSAISTDANSNVYISGWYSSDSIIFGADTLVDSGSLAKAFVARTGDSCAQTLLPVNTTDTSYLLVDSGTVAIVSATGNGVLSWYSKDSSGTYLGTGDSLAILVLIDTAVYVQDSSPCGVTARTVIKVGLRAKSAGIADVNRAANILVSPNPTTGIIYFKGIESGYKIEVYDMLGQVVLSTTSTGDNYSVDLAGNAKGLYLYRVFNNGASVQQGKIVLE